MGPVNSALCPLHSAHMWYYYSHVEGEKKKGGGGKKRKRGFGNADPNPHLLGNVGTSQKFEMKKLP